MTGAIVIVSHNNLHLTRQAVQTALKQTVPCFVLVIDNHSTDGTLAWLRARRRKALDEGQFLMVVRPFSPISLAACWNLGIGAFIDAGIDKVLVLNNDVEIRSDSYELLASYLWLQGGLVSMLATDDPSDMGTPGDRTIHDLRDSAVPHPDFSAFMISREVFDKVGVFDESYFPAYVEDCQMHVRMHRAGIPAVKVRLPFYHERSSTMANASPEEREFIERGAQRNRERFKNEFGCLPGTPEYDQLFL